MNKLNEIVQLLRKKGFPSTEIADETFLRGNDTHYVKLFKGISKNEFTNDREAAKSVLSASRRDKKYLMLKSRLKKRLINSLFFLDVQNNGESAIHKAFYKAHKDLCAAKILLLNNARTTAISIVKDLLNISAKYQFTEIGFSSAKMLRNHAGFTGAKKDYEYYNELVNKYLKTLEAESISENYLEKIRQEFVRSVAFKPDIIKETELALKKLKPLTRTHDSSILHLNMHRIEIMFEQMRGNYKSAITICNHTKEYLRKHTAYYNNIRLAELELIKLSCALQLGDYKNGNIYAEQCYILFPHDNSNWLIFSEYYFLLSMHTGNYNKAAEIMNHAMHHSKFRSLPEDRHEKWKIFEAYLHFVIPTYVTHEKSAFNLNKFLNEVPIYSKDKHGYNVSILIAQIILLLNENKYDSIVKKEDALRMYRNRYLKNSVNHRSNCFIKMLQILINHNFNYERTKQLAQKYLKSMRSAKLGSQGSLETLEVLPFEILWGKILERLKKRERVVR